MNEKHEHHPWLVLILVICALGLLALVGFFGYQLFYGDTISTVKRVEVDGSFLDDHVEENQRTVENNLDTLEIPVVEAESSIPLSTLEGTPISVGFSYPVDWHIFTTTVIDSRPGYIHSSFIDDQPIRLIEGESFHSVTISTIDRASADLGGHSFYLDFFDDIHPPSDPFYIETSRVTDRIHGNFVTAIQATESGILEANVEYVIYETADYSVVVKFIDLDSGDADNLAWEEIKNSLDFSTIK